MTTQILLPPAGRAHEANLTRRYFIEQAAWIWHEDGAAHESAFLSFQLTFTGDASTIRIHTSADQFGVLFYDDQLLARGPAAPDGDHWPFHTYEITPSPGTHRLRAEVWRLVDNLAPGQRGSLGGGFILAAEGKWHPLLSTGHAPWSVRRRRDWLPLPSPANLPVWIGCGIRRQLGADDSPVTPPRVQEHWWENCYGLVGGRWKLEPVGIPDPREETKSDFSIVASINRWLEPAAAFPAGERHRPHPAQPLASVGAQSALTLLLDLEDYCCGWPELSFRGGEGATIDCYFAESLLEPGDLTLPRPSKGDRAAVAGKHFAGFGDEWITDGREHTVTTHWWRAGRYVRLRVRTHDAPLELTAFSLQKTGYPWAFHAGPQIGDATFQRILRVAENGFVNCTHDLFADCPFYEQMQYAADARIMMLVGYVRSGDDRLARRAMIQFDRSRVRHGLPSMRVPSRADMVSTTFAFWWIGMVADFAQWRRDRAFVVARLPGIRATLDELDTYRNADGLLAAVPGWPFVDWGTPWDGPGKSHWDGVPPEARQGVSSIVNLHDALTRERVAELEDYAGRPEFAQRRRAEAAAIRNRCLRFVDPETGLVRDADGRPPESEHAQVFALLAGLFSPAERARPLAALRAQSLSAKASIYFLHHLFEVFNAHGIAAAMLERLTPWRQMLDRNLCTPIEEPEPNRSDCHGWGSHVLYHVVRGLLGLQPRGFEFRRALWRPDLGPLPFVEANVPHPDGELKLRAERLDTRVLRLVARVPAGLVLTLADGRELDEGNHLVEMETSDHDR